MRITKSEIMVDFIERNIWVFHTLSLSYFMVFGFKDLIGCFTLQ